MRRYSNIARPVQLAVTVDDNDTTIQVSSITGYPDAPFLLAIERGTAREELLYCEAKSDTPASFEVIRGYGGTTAYSHDVSDGVLVEHVTAALDHVEAGVLAIDETTRDSLDPLVPATGLGELWTGRLIYNTDIDELEVYTGAEWRPIIPPGKIDMYGGAAAPTGWLLCNGQAVNRTTYARLFDVIGETFGAGNGTTTFNVPDMQGRFPIGIGGTPAQALAATGGTWNHTHSVPTSGSSGSHAHGVGSISASSGGAASLGGVLTTSSSGNHSHTNPNTSTTGAHTHTNPNVSSAGSHSHSFSDFFTTGGPSSIPLTQSGAGAQRASHDHTHSGSVSGTTGSGGSHSHTQGATGSGGDHAHTIGSTSTIGAHTHTVTLSGSIAAHTHTIAGSTASGGAHTHAFADPTGTANPPFLAVNFIIRH